MEFLQLLILTVYPLYWHSRCCCQQVFDVRNWQWAQY